MYREGQKQGNADALSRMDYCRQCKTNHQVLVNSLDKTKPVVTDEVETVRSCLIEDITPSKSSPNEVIELWKIRNRLTVESNKLLVKENGIFRVVISQHIR